MSIRTIAGRSLVQELCTPIMKVEGSWRKSSRLFGTTGTSEYLTSGEERQQFITAVRPACPNNAEQLMSKVTQLHQVKRIEPDLQYAKALLLLVTLCLQCTPFTTPFTTTPPHTHTQTYPLTQAPVGKSGWQWPAGLGPGQCSWTTQIGCLCRIRWQWRGRWGSVRLHKEHTCNAI